jgi:hypothetical protein
MNDNKIDSELVSAEKQTNNGEKATGKHKSDKDVFWYKVEQMNIRDKKLKERVAAMSIEELQPFMKETFETGVFYEVLCDRKMPTKEMIAEKFDSIYHEDSVNWSSCIFTRRVCHCQWGRCLKDEMVDEMFNRVANVPFPTSCG